MNRFRTIAAPIAIMLCFAVLVVWLVPFRSFFELDPDEGVNLMKGLLVSKGYRLYAEIWSDQPPLFTWIMALVFKIAPTSVLAARLTVLAFATALVGAFFCVVRHRQGSLAACVAVGVLILSQSFVGLSVSVMVGMVSLSFFMISLWIADCRPFDSNVSAFASGVLSAASVATKLFTLPLVVLLLAFIPVRPKERLFWMLGFLSLAVPIGLVCGTTAWNQLVSPHVLAYQNAPSSWSLRSDFFRADFAFFALAIVGIGMLLTRRPREGMTRFFPLAFFGWGAIMFTLHKPYFYHHYVMLSIPIAWLCAVTIAAFLELAPRLSYPFLRSRAALCLLGLFLVLSVFRIEDIRDTWTDRLTTEMERSPQRSADLRALTEASKGNPWVYTDRPMYPFRAGLLVPPELAVMSSKRQGILIAQNREAQFAREVMDKYNIRQVLIGRSYFRSPEFHALLERRFKLVDTHHQDPYEIRRYLARE